MTDTTTAADRLLTIEEQNLIAEALDLAKAAHAVLANDATRTGSDSARKVRLFGNLAEFVKTANGLTLKVEDF